MTTTGKRSVMAAAIAMIMAGCGAPRPEPIPAAQPAEAAPPGLSEIAGTAPPGAVISLSSKGGDEPMPAGAAVMDQYSKRFEPALLYARVGQSVEFRNSEDMPHNVTVTRRGPGTTIFNVGTDPNEKYTHTFDRAGQYDVLCDVHPGMQATVVIADASRATLADQAGRFSLTGVPAGEYRARATFDGQTVEQDVTVAGRRIEVRLDGSR